MPKEVIKEVTKTPEACIALIDLDNAIFVKTGDAIGAFNFADLNTYLDSIASKRQALVSSCLAN